MEELLFPTGEQIRDSGRRHIFVSHCRWGIDSKDVGRRLGIIQHISLKMKQGLEFAGLELYFPIPVKAQYISMFHQPLYKSDQEHRGNCSCLQRQQLDWSNDTVYKARIQSAET